MKVLNCCVLFIALGLVLHSNAQELTCQVTVNSDRVQSQEKQVFQNLEEAISQFMNSQVWTKDEFEEEERIECNILITLQANSSLQNFNADVQVQAKRPVYGTDFKSTHFTFFDSKWNFSYNPSEPLFFSENTYTNELTSLCAFFAYMILGVDYDTFAPLGGSPHYERALNILNNSQQSSGGGWTSFGDQRDRYWLLDNLNSTQFEPFRQALYEYHRQGMDVFAENPEEARKMMVSAIEKIAEVRKLAPVSVAINAFFLAKNEELMNIFSRGDMELRTKVVNVLEEVNPKNASDYRKLLK